MTLNQKILSLKEKPMAEIAKILGVSKGCIEYRAKQLGIHRRHPKTVGLEKFIRENPLMPPSQIASKTGGKYESVIRAFRRIGLEPNLPYKEREIELFEVKEGIIKDILFCCPITGLPTQEKPDVRRRRA